MMAIYNTSVVAGVVNVITTVYPAIVSERLLKYTRSRAPVGRLFERRLFLLETRPTDNLKTDAVRPLYAPLPNRRTIVVYGLFNYRYVSHRVIIARVTTRLVVRRKAIIIRYYSLPSPIPSYARHKYLLSEYRGHPK